MHEEVKPSLCLLLIQQYLPRALVESLKVFSKRGNMALRDIIQWGRW